MCGSDYYDFETRYLKICNYSAPPKAHELILTILSLLQTESSLDIYIVNKLTKSYIIAFFLRLFKSPL